jgi:hypothetical protein
MEAAMNPARIMRGLIPLLIGMLLSLSACADDHNTQRFSYDRWGGWDGWRGWNHGWDDRWDHDGWHHAWDDHWRHDRWHDGPVVRHAGFTGHGTWHGGWGHGFAGHAGSGAFGGRGGGGHR